jgi:hypothetical protein
VVWSSRHRAAALAMASAALLLSAGSAAAAPTVVSWPVHVERPFVDCPGFSVVGVWDITHKLTLYPDEPATVRTF